VVAICIRAFSCQHFALHCSHSLGQGGCDSCDIVEAAGWHCSKCLSPTPTHMSVRGHSGSVPDACVMRHGAASVSSRSSTRTRILSIQPALLTGARRTAAHGGAAGAHSGPEQQPLLGFGTAAEELTGRDAHLDGLSDEQRAAVLADAKHVRRAFLCRLRLASRLSGVFP